MIRIGFLLLIMCMDIYFVKDLLQIYIYAESMPISLQYHEGDNKKGRGNERKCRSITHDQIDI